MNDKELNEKICVLLGFNKYIIKGINKEAWEYPERFHYLRAGSPCWELPNFLEIIENFRKISDITRGWKV